MVKSKGMSWSTHVSRLGRGGERNAYRILMVKPDGKRLLGSLYVLGNDVNMDFRKIGQGGMYWIDLAQDRDRRRAFMSMTMNSGFHTIFGNS
jgi:hypothetical protein